MPVKRQERVKQSPGQIKDGLCVISEINRPEANGKPATSGGCWLLRGMQGADRTDRRKTQGVRPQVAEGDCVESEILDRSPTWA